MAGELHTNAADDGHIAAARQVTKLLGVVVIALFVLLPLAAGLVWPAVASAAFVFTTIYLLGRFAASSDQQGTAQDALVDGDETAGTLSQTKSRVTQALVRRAWQAAVMGVCGFAPLGFYSLRLLWRLAGRDTPLGWADRLRCGLAYLFSLLAVLFCLVFVGLFAGGLLLFIRSLFCGLY